jgi:hypothetical protein
VARRQAVGAYRLARGRGWLRVTGYKLLRYGLYVILAKRDVRWDGVLVSVAPRSSAIRSY